MREKAASLALLVGALALPLAVSAQDADTVLYEVRFPNAVHHEVEITATFSGLPAETLELRMSRSSPGRYALHEFAKNVYSVRVSDGGGRALVPTRPDPYGWDVSGHDGTVRVTYTLFADRADGTYAGVDRNHAHLNAPATFIFGAALRSRPVRVTFHPPEGARWTAATQLGPTSDPLTFTAPDLDYLMDSPTELADLRVRQWSVSSGGADQTIRLAVHDPSDDVAVASFAEIAQRIVAEQVEVFGEAPDFDYGTYTFLACYGPWASGDGMEHRNSTSLTSQGTIAGNALGLLSALSHEFFHAWNMERIRSAALEPFDFERANMSDELWFGEGFTQYYTNLFLVRAGALEAERYVRSLAGTLNAVVNGPGRRFHSPVEMSRQAPFWDAGVSIDPTNRPNVFISYYTWGAAIALGLDMTLRSRFASTLDDFMRAMWERHGKPYDPYTLDDFRAVLGEHTGDAAFAEEFVERYVTGRDVLDYATLLAGAGVLVRSANPGLATLGPAGLAEDDGGVLVRQVYLGTPLYAAGIESGDRILALDGEDVSSVDQVDAAVGRHRPGEAVPVRFESRGLVLDATVALTEDATLEVLTYEEAGLPVGDSMRAQRVDWLRSRSEASPQP